MLEASQRTLGSEHPDTLRAMTGVADSYSDVGRRQEAMELREKVLETHSTLVNLTDFIRVHIINHNRR